MRNLRTFRSLCGQEVLENVLLTTTQWSNVNQAEAERRENRLHDQDFWGGLMGKGATLERFHGTRDSGLELIHKLMSKTPKRLDIQDQIVEQDMTLPETNAGQCVNEELIAQEKKFKEELESLENQLREAIGQRDDEIRALMDEQAKIQKRLEMAIAGMKLLAELHTREGKGTKQGRERRKRGIHMMGFD